MKSNKSNRGGRRQGAGRPSISAKSYTFRADDDMSAFIDTLDNKTDFIRGCVATQITSLKQQTQSNSIATLGEVTSANRIKPLSLPFFDIKLVAGFPVPLDNDEVAQDIDLLSMVCPHPDSSYLIRVMGNSMIEAGVYENDILIVDKSNRCPSEKQIAVCELNGEYTVKRVIEDSEGLWLVPANPDFPKIKVQEGDDFSVWGVVTYILHKPLY